MVNKTKILSDLSKMAVDAMDAFSGLKKEIETIAGLKVDKAINKLKLVKREEFDVLQKIVQELASKNSKVPKKSKKKTNTKKIYKKKKRLKK